MKSDRHVSLPLRGIAFCLLLLSVWACPAMAQEARTAKYVFLVIGDGMGEAQWQLGEAYAAAKAQAAGQEYISPVKDWPTRGQMITRSADKDVTDSAAAGTALACGVKTNNGMIAMTPDGQGLPTLAEQARQRGMKVGIISNVSLDHATPAAFYAHDASRNNYYDIAMQMAGSGVDFFGGGSVIGERDKDKPSPSEAARKAGYAVIQLPRKVDSLPPVEKVWVMPTTLAAKQAMPYALDRPAGEPSLADITALGIGHLDGETGFFMMIEGGKIDWACHANDAAATAADTADLIDVLTTIETFRKQHPDETLVVFTADHETGGMTFDPNADVAPLLDQQGSGEMLIGRALSGFEPEKANAEDVIAEVAKTFRLDELSEDEQAQLQAAVAAWQAGKKLSGEDRKLYGSYNPLAIAAQRILARRAGAGFTSFNHTAVDVPLWAVGPGAEAFNGRLDNTDVAKAILCALPALQVAP
jgi:alkaline phosphatase